MIELIKITCVKSEFQYKTNNEENRNHLWFRNMLTLYSQNLTNKILKG